MNRDKSQAQASKKPYRKPTLRRLGRIERLTTGGSGPTMELAMGQTAMNMNFFP